MNKSTTIVWYDDIVPKSYKLVLADYKLKCLKAVELNSDETELTVYGDEADLASFMADLEDYSFSTLEKYNIDFPDDDEQYAAAMNFAIDTIG